MSNFGQKSNKNDKTLYHQLGRKYNTFNLLSQ